MFAIVAKQFIIFCFNFFLFAFLLQRKMSFVHAGGLYPIAIYNIINVCFGSIFINFFYFVFLLRLFQINSSFCVFCFVFVSCRSSEKVINMSLSYVAQEQNADRRCGVQMKTNKNKIKQKKQKSKSYTRAIESFFFYDNRLCSVYARARDVFATWTLLCRDHNKKNRKIKKRFEKSFHGDTNVHPFIREWCRQYNL